jgi:hypothetical protein
MPMLKAAAKSWGRSVATLLNTYQVDVATRLQPILSSLNMCSKHDPLRENLQKAPYIRGSKQWFPVGITVLSRKPVDQLTRKPVDQLLAPHCPDSRSLQKLSTPPFHLFPTLDWCEKMATKGPTLAHEIRDLSASKLIYSSSYAQLSSTKFVYSHKEGERERENT